MKSLTVFAAIAVLACALAWLRPGVAASPESQFIVTFSDTQITVVAPGGEEKTVAWKALTKVGIRTTDEGPWQPDVFWRLHTGAEKPTLVFPSGATGEGALFEAMQHRLAGFDNEAAIKAMGSTSNAFFTVWVAPHASTK